MVKRQEANIFQTVSNQVEQLCYAEWIRDVYVKEERRDTRQIGNNKLKCILTRSEKYNRKQPSTNE